MAKATQEKQEEKFETAAQALENETPAGTVPEPAEETPDQSDVIAKLKKEREAMKAEAKANKEKLELAKETQKTGVLNPEEKDPWKRIMRVQSPRLPGNGVDYHFVSVNDHRWQIPADGKYYELPEPIALALKDYVQAEIKAEEFLKKVEKESSDPILKPKEY